MRKRFWRENAAEPCAVCGDLIAPAQRSIDHIRPWANLRVGATVRMVGKRNIHWEVVLLPELQAMCNRPA